MCPWGMGWLRVAGVLVTEAGGQLILKYKENILWLLLSVSVY